MTPPIDDATPEDVEDFWFNERYEDLVHHRGILKDQIANAVIALDSRLLSNSVMSFIESLADDRRKCMEAMEAMLPHPVIGPALMWMQKDRVS